MPNYVPGIGNPNAKIMIVGEAPGEREDKEMEPFVGPAGNLLNEVLRYADIERSDCYITNVVKVRPPQNDLRKLNLIGRSIDEFLPQLDEEIRSINPNVIFALGNTSLYHLTGNNGIMSYRGSILPSVRSHHKIIPSIHPAAILHGNDAAASSGQYKDLFLLKMDAVRAREQSEFPEIRRPSRSITIAKSSQTIDDWFKRNKKNEPNEIISQSKFPLHLRCVVDIETFKTYPMCIGLACNSWDAISIPIFSDYWGNNDLCFIWETIAEFFAREDVQLIGQNAKFDSKKMRNVGLHWRDVWFDIMFAWHTLFAELRKDLATISSILTEEPYYKSEGKEFNPKKDSFDKLMTYNAKDAYTEWECYERLHEMLIEENMEEFFFNRVMPLNNLYDRIEDIGILVDVQQRKLLQKAYEEKRSKKEAQLLEIINILLGGGVTKFNCNSPKQVASLIYGMLKIPLRKDTGEDTLKSLINNTVKDPLKKQILTLILEIRKLSKVESNYIAFELK